MYDLGVVENRGYSGLSVSFNAGENSLNTRAAAENIASVTRSAPNIVVESTKTIKVALEQSRGIVLLKNDRQVSEGEQFPEHKLPPSSEFDSTQNRSEDFGPEVIPVNAD